MPFGVTLPWETPVTELYGQPLGVVLGVRTELSVAGAKDKGDPDPLTVGPLPAQEAILEALGRLGFGFKSADLEYGRIRGTGAGNCPSTRRSRPPRRRSTRTW